jgi:CheY-like chemotaxis protein
VAQAQTRDAAILCLSVTDTGSGMPEEVCAKLFSPFTQAEASTAARHGGTGLGLSISKGLAEMMGGEIGVESRVGEGSRFWFTVPASIVEVCAFEPRPVVESRGTTLAGMKILVAEDNAVNQRVVDRLLTKLGCSVEIAPDGAAAVAAVERSPFDLILMDYHMPKMSGPEAARAIRARPGAQRVPIIALTASADADDQQKCLDAGMDEILPKPFRPEQLLAVVERCRMPVGARLAGSRR